MMEDVFFAEVPRWLQDNSTSVAGANSTIVKNNQSFNDAAVLRNTLRLYGSIFLVMLVCFCVVRKKYPKIYSLRSWVDGLMTPMAQKQFGFLSWMYKLYLLSDTEFLDECGMDALCYTRVLEFGVKLSAVGMIVAVFLIPVYYTAPVSAETIGITDTVVKMSTTNVGPGDFRFLATVLGAYVIFGYAMYNILYEFQWFYMMRFQFLRKPLPRNYTVYVRCIPEDLLGQTQLKRHFERFSRIATAHGETTGVLESVIALETPNIRKKMAERDRLISKLEHTINIETVKGTTPLDKKTSRPLVEVMYERLDDLNQQITTMIEHVEQLQATEDRRERQDDNDVPHDISCASSELRRRKPKKSITDTTAKENDPSSSESDLNGEDYGGKTSDLSDSNRYSSRPNSFHSTTSMIKLAGSFATRTAGVAVNTVSKTANVAANTVSKTANVAASAVQDGVGAALSLFSSEDGKPMTAGFVTFTNLQAVHAARQMIQVPQPFAMEVMEAPAPDDVYWGNVGKKHRELQIGKLISISLTTLLCLFWTVPMSFISSLSTIEGLREIEWINRMLDKLPWLEPVLAQLAPLLIVVANQLLKVILEFLSTFEGPVSGAVVQASLFGKLSVFMIIQTFFVSAISGSLISQFSAFFQDTSLIIDLLAKSLPAQSTYFIQILLVDTSINLTIELLRIVAVAQAGIRSIVGPNLTDEERKTTWMGLRPLADPSEFGHADTMSAIVLYFVVFFVYAVIAPITCIFMFICFLLIGAAYRHQFVYIYPTKPDSGGALFVQFMKLVPSCILIGEITIAGFLGLKKTPAASALMVPLLIITILFVIYLGQQHYLMTRFLSAQQCMDEDRKNNAGHPMDMSFLKGKYIQPEMRKKKDFPSNASLEFHRTHGLHGPSTVQKGDSISSGNALQSVMGSHGSSKVVDYV